MAQFCTKCGASLEDGEAFCTECGVKVTTTAQVPPVEATSQSVVQEEVVSAVGTVQEISQPVMQMIEVAPPQQEQPVPQQIPPVQATPQQQVTPKVQEEPPRGKYAVAGTGAYFGFMFLFGIPVIGWLVCFISAFAMKNKNLKNYAKSRVIWFFIKAVFWIGIFFLLRWIGNMIMDFIEGFFESELGGLSDLIEQFKGLTEGMEALEGLENIPVQ